MQLNSLPNNVKAADLPLEKLAGNTSLTERDKVGEATRQFEAVLLRQILTSAQKPVFPSTYNPQSLASEIYRDLIVERTADTVSRSNAFGLGRILAAQMTRENSAPPTAAAGQDSTDLKAIKL